MNRLICCAQLAVLRFLYLFKKNWRSLPLFYPRLRLFCGGRLPLVSFREVFCDQTYVPPINIGTVARIIDGGAHIGLAAIGFSRLYPHAEIFAFEPNPTAFAILEQNVSQLETNNIKPTLAALGAEYGTASIFIEDFDGIPTDATLLPPHTDKSGQSEQVPVVDIRNYAEGSIVDLLKLDIEGSEYACLEALSPEPTKIRNLVIEFHRLGKMAGEFNRLLSMLKQRGYRIATETGAELALPVDPQDNAVVIWALGHNPG